MKRCRFWPNCDRAPGCAFHHPSKSCVNFPNCPFGDECLYVHPLCKFKAQCQRPYCPFTHDLKGTVDPLVFETQYPTHQFSTSKSSTPCRYKSKCANPNCEFAHPPTCRFGLACRTSRCTFVHKRPDLKKFQWTPATSS